jgi:trimeric autotransporter adhesin
VPPRDFTNQDDADMTNTRRLLFGFLTLTIAACGGRSTLHVQTADGGGYSEAGTLDGKRDGLADGARVGDGGPASTNPDQAVPNDNPDFSLGSPSDAALDGRGDGGPPNNRPDGVASDGRNDVAQTDGRNDVAQTDGRNDVAQTDGLPDGARPADGRDVALPDGPLDLPALPDGPPREGPPGRPDVAPPVTLTGIEISPASPIVVNVGTPRQILVTAVFSNNTTQDVSGSAAVTSADTSILTVSGTTLNGKGTTVASTTITATYQGQTATATVTVNGTNPLVSISINRVPANPLAAGAMVSLTATGVFTDGTRQDVTSQATWTSSAPSIATVEDTGATKGRVTAVAAGTFTVSATVGTIVGTSATMTVSSKKLVSIAITPSTPTLQRGLANQAFVATGSYDDQSTGDVTQQATWSSDNTGVVTVVATGANAGRVSTVAAGTATVTASVTTAAGTVTGTDLVTVVSPQLRTITISGPSVLVIGNTGYYTALGTYADNSTADLTTTVTWSSSDTKILTVSNAVGAQGEGSGVAVGTANVRASLGNVSATPYRVTVSEAPLISITVAPNPLDNVIVGLASALKATGLYGDPANVNTQFSLDVTTSATWTVSSSAIATVGNSADTAGQVTGVAPGSTTVTATLSGKSATATVNVISASLDSIAVNPTTASVRVGQTYPFTAIGSFDNNTTRDITNDVTWSSSAEATATISNAAGSKGVAKGVAASATAVTITATMSGKIQTASLTVTEPRIVGIQISPSAAQTIDTGATQGYTVAGIYENGTTTNALTGVTWSSSNTAVATVAANGGGRGGGPGGGGATATAVAAGSTTIKATYTSADGTVFTDSVTLTVQAPPTVIAIRLSPASSTIYVGDTQVYTVDADYSNGTTTAANGATLTTSNGTVAAVSGGGRGGGGGLMVVGQAAGGPVTITASYTAGGQTFTDTATLTVKEANTVTGLYIEPASASVVLNGTQQFRAFTQNSDGTTTDVTGNASTAWSTSDGTLATITTGAAGGGRGAVFAPGGGGLATGVGVGTPVITATYTPATGSAVSATATLTVTNPTPRALLITPSAASMLLNGSQAFTATLIYADGSSTNVTSSASWATSDPNVVVMTNPSTGGRGGGPGGGGIVGGGTATAVGTGDADVTATYTPPNSTTALTATASVTVTDPPIRSLEISPTTPTVYLSSGPNQQFTATVIFTDYSRRDVTATAQWTSSDPSVAVVSTSGANTGRATGLKVGTARITASYTGTGGTFTAWTDLTVTDRKLSSVEVSPTNPTTHVGITQSFVATALYDNGTRATVTGGATWTSSDNSVATVGPSGASAGVATPVKAGSATITASFGGMQGTSVLTVDSGTLSSIVITPSPLSVAVGGRQQLAATGTYTTGPDQDLTSSVTWLSTDAVATVSNATGSRGLLTAVAVGSAAVQAKFLGVTGNLTVAVTNGAVTIDAGP